MPSLIEDINNAIQEAEKTETDINDLLKGRTYISDAGGMMIRSPKINIQEKKFLLPQMERRKY